MVLDIFGLVHHVTSLLSLFTKDILLDNCLLVGINDDVGEISHSQNKMDHLQVKLYSFFKLGTITT